MVTETKVFRLGTGEHIMHWTILGLFGVLIIGSLITGVSTLAGGDMAGLIFIAIAACIIILFDYVRRDGHGRLGWQVGIGADAVFLNLPAGRSFLGKPPAFRDAISFADIASVEHRKEYYSALGIDADTKSWALRLKDGRVIVLGDDRPIPRQPGTHTTIVGEAARAIAAAAGARIIGRKGVKGRPGFLAILGASAPDW